MYFDPQKTWVQFSSPLAIAFVTLYKFPELSKAPCSCVHKGNDNITFNNDLNVERTHLKHLDKTEAQESVHKHYGPNWTLADRLYLSLVRWCKERKSLVTETIFLLNFDSQEMAEILILIGKQML